MAASTLMVLGFLILCFPAAVHCIRPPAKGPAPVVLPLRTRKLASSSLPRQQPNKLVFHHNVSLTVTLTVGTPPQNVSMVLDTGSELSWLLCNSSAAAFHPRASTSYATVPCSSPTCQSQARDLPSPPYCDDPSGAGRGRCHVSLTYADASSSDGALATDAFRLGQYPPLRAVFGCMDTAFSSTGDAEPAAGILGMNRGALSFVTQTDTRRFSYCISDRDGTGLLLLGEPAPSAVGGGEGAVRLSYTPMVEVSLPLPYFDRVAYSVQLEGIRVGPTLLPIPRSALVPDHTGAGQTMVDSGSQFTFLLGAAYGPLKEEFRRQTRGLLSPVADPGFVFQGAFDACFEAPAGVEARLPAVTLVFSGGAEVRVGGERLLYRAAQARDRWCLTFGNSDLVPMAAYVIGHHHQQNLWVEYDLDRGRVGFAPVRCDLVSQRLGVSL